MVIRCHGTARPDRSLGEVARDLPCPALSCSGAYKDRRRISSFKGALLGAAAGFGYDILRLGRHTTPSSTEPSLMDESPRTAQRGAMTPAEPTARLQSPPRLGLYLACATAFLAAACAGEEDPSAAAQPEIDSTAPPSMEASKPAAPTGAEVEPVPQAPAETKVVDVPALVADLFDEDEIDAALETFDASWQDPFAAALVDFLRVSYEKQQPGFREACFAVIDLLEAKSGESLGGSISKWYRWLWDQEVAELQEAARVKAILFERIDPRFRGYFGDGDPEGEWTPWKRTIRLDEVRWGGVEQDGIPPLRSPEVMAADEADYLADTDVVYGVIAGDEARAYPRRILGWHELVTDRLGGVDIAGVYCTLCGTMIVYDTRGEDGLHEMGTSGFLYRSNKLMYDAKTQSLWSTLLGTPVIGPLVETETRLVRRGVVTTTWGEWKRRHPKTTVLALDTGYDRNYDEGAAYAEYYATDELMFDVPHHDPRLANKAEIIGLAEEGPDATSALALSVDFLRAHPVHVGALGEKSFLCLTDPTGAVRVFGPLDKESLAAWKGATWDGASSLTDAAGEKWTVTEDAATEAKQGTRLPRQASTRAFWFAWLAAHPETELTL